MNHRLFRRVLMIALLLFVPLSGTSAWAGDVDGALAYVPQTSFTVIVAKMDRVKKSPIFEQAKQMLFANEPKAKENIDKLKRETGFDVFADVEVLVVALGENITHDDDDFVAIVETKVNEAKLVAFIKKEGGKLEKKNDAAGGHYVLGSDKKSRMAFRDKFVIIGGQKAFDAAMKKQGMAAGLKARLDSVKSYDVYAAALTNPALRDKLGKEDPQLGQVDKASAGINLVSGLDVLAVVEFMTAAPAQELAKQANQGLAEAKKARELQRMGLTRYLEKITVKAAGRKLSATLRLSAADVKKLGELLKDLL